MLLLMIFSEEGRTLLRLEDHHSGNTSWPPFLVASVAILANSLFCYSFCCDIGHRPFLQQLPLRYWPTAFSATASVATLANGTFSNSFRCDIGQLPLRYWPTAFSATVSVAILGVHGRKVEWEGSGNGQREELGMRRAQCRR